jgi:YHS domain-containing protein
MEQDPVDGTRIDAGRAAAKATYRGQTYFFASVENKELFEANPEAYVPADASDPTERAVNETIDDNPLPIVPPPAR